MRYQSRATAIPLPFATAGVGLCLSYVFRTHVNAPAATAIGFLFGVIALYFSGYGATASGSGSQRTERISPSVIGLNQPQSARKLRAD